MTMRSRSVAKLSDGLARPPRCRAAAYVRMSREHQQYSITNQLQAIGDYADLHSLEIVRIYEDAARSGLSLRGRRGLQKLLQDVVSRSADYTRLLVYDVSRWGRFQDADESGHYEFLCRSHGVDVVYCVDDFVNDGSVASTIMKAYKRAFAADYSRQLSSKVFTTQCLLASRGHSPGSTCPYGLKRVAVDVNGRVRKTLKRGHLKDVESDHIVLAPGSRDEVKVVREIFKLLVKDRLSVRGIARHLNARSIPSPSGKDWKAPTVRHILGCEKYIGTQFYNRTSAKLQKPKTRNPVEVWIQKEGAFSAIVAPRQFAQAQRLLRLPYQKRSDEDLLARLRKHLEMHGTITGIGMRAKNGLANLDTYKTRFGSLRKACELVGFTQLRNFRAYDEGIRKRAVRFAELERLSRIVEARGSSLIFSATAHRFKLGDELEGYFDLRRCTGEPLTSPRWRLRFPMRDRVDVYVFGRQITGDVPVDYYAIPRVEALAPTCTIRSPDERLDRYRYRNLETLGAALAAIARPVLHRAAKVGHARFD